VILIDTSYLVALKVRTDALHAQAVACSAVLSGPLVTTEYVLWEFINRLSTPPHRRTAHEFVRFMCQSPSIRVVEATEKWFRLGLAAHERYADKSWTLTDCISFEVMRSLGAAEALIYDVHFEQAGFRALLRYPAHDPRQSICLPSRDRQAMGCR